MYNTGDWVKVDEQGQIFYLQRKDDQIKRFGKRLNLQEIDSVSKTVFPQIMQNKIKTTKKIIPVNSLLSNK